MKNLNTEIKAEILEYLKTARIGASSSEIAKNIGHNRITVSKYLEIMKAHKLIDFEGVAQAKLWSINKKSDKPKILIVDDEPNVVELVALSLIPEKFHIIKAYSGLDALDKVYQKTPDLIILDLMMPGINGYELCQKLKENALTQHIPIIILSAKGEIEDKLKGLKIGADDYITKPFDPMELEARVEMVIRRTSQDIDTHPLTKLPGKEAIKERIGKLLHKKENFILYNLRIANFDEFNKVYGYKKGEHIIMVLSRIFTDNVNICNKFFIGHTLKDNFVVITDDNNFLTMVDESFNRVIPHFYEEDKLKEKISLRRNTLTSIEISSKNLDVNKILKVLEVS